MMSYCWPHWFSDYNYKKLYNDQRAHGSTLLASPVNSLFIRASIEADGVTVLQPIYPLLSTPDEIPETSEYVVQLLDSVDNVLASYPVRVLQAEEDGFVARTISTIVPSTSQAFATVRLIQSGQLISERHLLNRSALSKPIIVQTNQALALRWDRPDIPALVRYTTDDGKSWTTLGIDVSGGKLQVEPNMLPSGVGHFEIILADSRQPIDLNR